MNDIVLSASTNALCLFIMAKLTSEISMKDLGSLGYFLGIVVTKYTKGLFLSQTKYASEILDSVGMTTISLTSVETTSKLSVISGALYHNPTFFPINLYYIPKRKG